MSGTDRLLVVCLERQTSCQATDPYHSGDSLVCYDLLTTSNMEDGLLRYDMSTLLVLTKWLPNFRMILICYFFSADDV